MRQGWIEYKIVKGDTTYLRDAHYPRFSIIGWVTYPASADLPAVTIIGVDNWILSLPFLALAYVLWKRLTRLQHGTPGLCPICHYDLRAHKPGQKCPECGTEIPRFGWGSRKS